MNGADVKTESVAEFLARGGKVKKLRPRDERFAKHTSHFHFGNNPSWLMGARKIENAFRKTRPPRYVGTLPFLGNRGATGKRSFSKAEKAGNK